MKPDTIVTWLGVLGIQVAKVGAEWVTVSCPLAQWRHSGWDSNPSFGIHVGAGESGVYCFGCRYRGTQSMLLMDLSTRGIGIPARAWALIEEAREQMDLDPEELVYNDHGALKPEYEFPEWLLDVFEPAYHAEGEQVHPYLAQRGMPYEIAAKIDMRYDPLDSRVVFPVRDWKGRLMGMHGRATYPDPKIPYLMYPHDGHTNPKVLFGEHWADLNQPLVMAESVFDAARVMEVYPNVVSPLTAGVGAAKLERLAGAGLIITLFDRDKAGAQGRRAVTEVFSNAVHLEPPEGCKDAGDMSPEQVEDALSPFVD